MYYAVFIRGYFADICVSDKTTPKPLNNTLTGTHVPTWTPGPGLYQTQQELSLQNGDVCRPGSFVIVRDPQLLGQTFVARVEEIIQRSKSVASFASQPDGILLQKMDIDKARTRYGMPSMKSSGKWSMHATKVGIFR